MENYHQKYFWFKIFRFIFKYVFAPLTTIPLFYFILINSYNLNFLLNLLIFSFVLLFYSFLKLTHLTFLFLYETAYSIERFLKNMNSKNYVKIIKNIDKSISLYSANLSLIYFKDSSKQRVIRYSIFRLVQFKNWIEIYKFKKSEMKKLINILKNLAEEIYKENYFNIFQKINELPSLKIFKKANKIEDLYNAYWEDRLKHIKTGEVLLGRIEKVIEFIDKYKYLIIALLIFIYFIFSGNTAYLFKSIGL